MLRRSYAICSEIVKKVEKNMFDILWLIGSLILLIGGMSCLGYCLIRSFFVCDGCKKFDIHPAKFMKRRYCEKCSEIIVVAFFENIDQF